MRRSTTCTRLTSHNSQEESQNRINRRRQEESKDGQEESQDGQEEAGEDVLHSKRASTPSYCSDIEEERCCSSSHMTYHVHDIYDVDVP
jgi:hypothetical protein